MIKQWIEKQFVFTSILQFLTILSEWELSENSIPLLTEMLAKLNLSLNAPKKTEDVSELVTTWKNLMPPDGQEYFKITEIDKDTAYAEIHLHCPLRGTGKVETCYKFMNYDRSLLKEVGGSLIVLESQSNSGNSYCKLAIRKLESSTDDLVPAHKKINP